MKTKRTAGILSKEPYKALASLFLSIVLALSLSSISCVLPESYAYASVNKTDVIGEGTLEDRVIPASFAPNVDSKYVYLCDSEGNVYFSREAETQTPIASVTKIMTAIVALEEAPLDATITVSADAGEVGESTSGLIAGDELTLEDAIAGLMIPSGNDAAIAIAESLGKTILENAESQGLELTREDGSAISAGDDNASYDAFVAAMNNKAKELNCQNTLFTNPHGLDFGEFDGNLHSTAKDVGIISAYAMQNEVFRNTVKMETATIPVKRGGRTIELKVETTDTLLGRYNGACGIKTGFTDRAGSCFVGACERDGVYLYAVVLGSSTHEQRFIDAENLYNWVYDNQKSIKLANSDVTYDMTLNGQQTSVPVIGYAPLADWIDKTVPATFADNNAEVQISAIFGNVSQDIVFDEIKGSVSAGQVIGHADFYQDNSKIASQEIIACQDVSAPNILESISIGWQRFLNNFSGGQNVSNPEILNQMPIVLQKT